MIRSKKQSQLKNKRKRKMRMKKMNFYGSQRAKLRRKIKKKGQRRSLWGIWLNEDILSLLKSRINNTIIFRKWQNKLRSKKIIKSNKNLKKRRQPRLKKKRSWLKNFQRKHLNDKSNLKRGPKWRKKALQ